MLGNDSLDALVAGFPEQNLVGYQSSYISPGFQEVVHTEKMIEGSRVYRPRFWRDHVWIGVTLAVLGLPLMILGLVMVCAAIIQWTAVPVSPGSQVNPAVFLFLAVLFYPVGHLLFYIFWHLLKSEVVFAPDCLVYGHPSVFLFSHSEVRVPMESIGSVMLGQVAMSHIVPGALDTALARAPFVRSIGIEIGYERGGKIRTLSLPIINDPSYFSEIGGLIERLHLVPRKAPFIFMKEDWDRLPRRSWIERIIPYLEIGFFILSIVALIMEFM